MSKYGKLEAGISRAAEVYRPIGGWIERPSDPQPALEGEVHADVVIVGAGFAGLSTALELNARGAKVVVLEKEFGGFGASGRNAGYLAGGQGLDYHLFMKRVSREQVSKIIHYFEDGVRYVERKLEEYGIDCDYLQSGLIRAGIHESQRKSLRDNMKLGIELGAPARYLDEAEMRARGIPPAFRFGYATPGGGTLHPGKYVSGLRRVAIAAGVKLYENSPVQSFTQGATIICRTDRGAVHAPSLVLASNAYTPQLGLLRDKVVPLRVGAIETEPLSAEQLASLDWPNREGLTTQHLVMESHRLTAHNSLIITTKRLGYNYGSSTPGFQDKPTYRELAIALYERFPTLRDVSIRSSWSGFISFAYDGLPVVGETGEHRNIHYTAGCSGHGVGTQSFVGELLAERIMGETHPYYPALQHKTPSTLPEPLQWVVMKSLLGGAHIMDERVNRRVRRGG